MTTWTGPTERDLAEKRAPLPPERWPYGPPDHHEPSCRLFAGRHGCDCLASDASDTTHGATP